MRRRHVGVTVVATVLDEGPAIDRLMSSLLDGARRPDAVVVVDGGSRDDTVERLCRYAHGTVPVDVVSVPGANIAAGRNAAVARAHTEWVAVTDAGVALDAGWLERLMEPVEAKTSGPPPDAVAGFFLADPRNVLEEALGATTLPLVEEVDPRTFLPSSRSFACSVRAWRSVGGYPEWLDYCEDVVFDLRLRFAGARFAWAPAAVAHFRPRATPAAFWRQYYRYARGDGKAGLWPRRHALRYGAYLTAGVVAILARRGAAGARVSLAAVIAAACAYMSRPAVRVLRLRRPIRETAAALTLLPALRLTGDVAKMAGYPVGLMWRFRHRPPNWRTVSPYAAWMGPPESS